MLRMAVAFAVAATLLSVPALAQQTGPNGGLVAGKGGHQTELVLSPTELSVYLLDGGKPHETTGTKARAIIQQSGKTITVSLVDQQGKKLVGMLESPVERGAIVVISGKDHHGDPISARYTVK